MNLQIVVQSYFSSFAKLFEKIVSRQIMGFLNANNVLYKHQYGFREKHTKNTSHPVLYFTHKISIHLNKTLAVFIDLKKTFLLLFMNEYF